MEDGNKQPAPEMSGRLFWALGLLAALVLAIGFWYVTAPAPVPEGAGTTGDSQKQPVVAAPSAEATAGTETERSAPEKPSAAPAEASGAATGPQAGSADSTAPDAAAPGDSESGPTLPEPPSFDTVRVDRDGSVLVAGHTQAGQEVSVLVDGAKAVSAASDGRGDFAALFSIMPSDEPRVLSLVTTMPDGSMLKSKAEVVIAPFAAPESATADAGGTIAQLAEGARVATGEPPGPDVLIVDDSGVKRQSVGAAVDAIVIDTIGYGAQGEVEIAGRAPPAGFARLYLDNAAVATVQIAGDGGWSAVLDGIAAGIYTLRVDQIGADGQVLSRFETPFQREAPDVVIAALGGASGDEAPVAGAEAPAAPLPGVAPAAPVSGDAEGASPAAGTLAEGQAPATVVQEAAPAAGLPAAPAPDADAVATRAAIVTVQPGFTLWRIARENYGEGVLYVKVFEANKDQIRNPDLIYPGQVFTVPSQ